MKCWARWQKDLRTLNKHESHCILHVFHKIRLISKEAFILTRKWFLCFAHATKFSASLFSLWFSWSVPVTSLFLCTTVLSPNLPTTYTSVYRFSLFQVAAQTTTRKLIVQSFWMPKQQGDNVQTLEMKYLNLIFLVSVLDTSIVYILEFVFFFLVLLSKFFKSNVDFWEDMWQCGMYCFKWSYVSCECWGTNNLLLTQKFVSAWH